jgi:hypothetical protein
VSDIEKPGPGKPLFAASSLLQLRHKFILFFFALGISLIDA